VSGLERAACRGVASDAAIRVPLAASAIICCMPSYWLIRTAVMPHSPLSAGLVAWFGSALAPAVGAHRGHNREHCYERQMPHEHSIGCSGRNH